MNRNLLLLAIALAIVAALAAILWLVPEAQEARAPKLLRAWVGVEVDGDGVARTGTVELDAGRAFRLHAVVEARRGDAADGETAYYSEASKVLIGDRETAAALPVADLGALGTLRVLWFTVEHGVPFRELQHGAALDSFRYEEFFRPEWGSAWSIDGTLDAFFDGLLEREGPDLERDFGTLRYRVWVEASVNEDALVPEQRVKSDELPGATRVVARLPGALGPASAVFGLPAIERGDGDWDQAALARLQELHRGGLAFSQLALLRELLDAAGTRWEDLDWRRASLEHRAPESGPDGRLAWREAGSVDSSKSSGLAAPGDLIRVADRWVVLLRDNAGEGAPGMLDGADLCLDFGAGAAARRLDQIFLLGDEGEGDVFVASLGSEPAGPGAPPA